MASACNFFTLTGNFFSRLTPG